LLALATAVRRARRFGQGGDINRYKDKYSGHPKVDSTAALVELYTAKFSNLTELPILDLRLDDVQGVLSALKELESDLVKMLEAEGVIEADLKLDPRLLPLEIRVALKQVAEAIATLVLNLDTRYAGQIRVPIGSLLATCDPRTAEVEFRVDMLVGVSVYHILYACKSHRNTKLKLSIVLHVYEYKQYKNIDIDNAVWWVS
jgi:hypothetical protein